VTGRVRILLLHQQAGCLCAVSQTSLGLTHVMRRSVRRAGLVNGQIRRVQDCRPAGVPATAPSIACVHLGWKHSPATATASAAAAVLNGQGGSGSFKCQIVVRSRRSIGGASHGPVTSQEFFA